MGLFDNIGSGVPGGNLSKPIMIALLALLASRAFGGGKSAESGTHDPASAAPSGGILGDAAGGGLLGGLGGLLDRFRQSGYGNIIDSWIGTGENKPIEPKQLGQALGPNAVEDLSKRTGLPQNDLLAQLSQFLPGLVDKLTPQGQLPSEDEVDRKLRTP